jgi:hypothetical protein
MKKGPHFSSKKSTKKWFYQLPLDVMYAKNRKNHFFVFFGIHYVQPNPENGKIIELPLPRFLLCDRDELPAKNDGH